ncbi:MAG: CHAD domain-containing protein [Methylococcaceae bacterium]|nr:CHAD domain-containing protein [Methylococcaceae bacterium]
MIAIPLHFDLPKNLSAKKFINKLSKNLDIQLSNQQYTIKILFDSFDWRLYNADIICEFNHSNSASQLSLIDRNSGKLLALENMPDMMRFTDQFPKGRLRTTLAPVLEMRALIPLCQLPHNAHQLNILNKDQKIILRIQLDEHELIANQLHLYPLKGYDKALKKVTNILQNTFDLNPTKYSILKAGLKLEGRKPKDYSSKFRININPDMRADEACKKIYQQLIQVMQFNEAGTLADIDTEFLHDFRVAVRRTRTGLSQLKNTLPTKEINRYADFFAWLGQITGPTRDLDVYLLSFKKYKEVLPISLREDLTPLYTLLKDKQKHAQKKLTENLSRSEYRTQLNDWETFLTQQPITKKGKKNGIHLTVKQLADQRIWKVYKHVLKEAKDISESSPAEALHDLRKTCKKLRYLLEFFQTLYPEDDMKIILKALKKFQTVLGDFQDYEVQEINIKQFSEEMMANKVSPNTFLAMGVLVQYLDSMKCQARAEFSNQFALFEQAENKHIFKNLFSNKFSVKK